MRQFVDGEIHFTVAQSHKEVAKTERLVTATGKTMSQKLEESLKVMTDNTVHDIAKSFWCITIKSTFHSEAYFESTKYFARWIPHLLTDIPRVHLQMANQLLRYYKIQAKAICKLCY